MILTARRAAQRIPPTVPTMSITFIWLFMGHFLGDWVLQNDWMARGKKEALLSLPGFMHFSIYTAIVIAALLFSGVSGRHPTFYLAAGVLVFVSHWLIDATDSVERWMRFYRQSRLEIVRMMVDQILHLLVLFVLAVAAIEA
jgi:hypothetical protein